MNRWQMAQQIRHELESVRWQWGSQELVFGARGVVVTAAGITEEQIPKGFPFALVQLDSGSADPEHPELLTEQFTILVAANVAGDAMGEHAIIGGPTADLGHSAGRGCAELSERARYALQDLTGADGAKIILSGSQTEAPVTLGRGKHLAMESFALEAICTSQPHYAAPQEVTYSAGTWSWQGSHCSERYDFIQFRLVGHASTIPPKTPDEGSVVYTGTQAQASHTANNGWSYTVFADYGSRGRLEASSTDEVGSTYTGTALARRVFGYSEASFTRSTDVTPYSEWDVVGGILTFDGCADAVGGSGAWHDFVVSVNGYSSLDPVFLYVFDRYPQKSVITDNARFQIHVNDLPHVVGVRLSRALQPLNKGYVVAGDDDLYSFSSHDPTLPPDYPDAFSYICSTNTAKLYGVLVAGADQSASFPPVSGSEWTVRLLLERD